MLNRPDTIDSLGSWLVDLPRWPKRVVLVLADLVLLSFALWLAFSLRLSTPYVPESLEFGLLLTTAPLIGVLTFHYLGFYKLVTRYIGQKGSVRILAAVVLSVLFWSLLVLLSGIKGMLPRSTVIVYAIFAASFVFASRQLAGWLLKRVPYATPASFDLERKRVVIYGAGPTGVELLDALQRLPGYEPVGFIDENSTLWGQKVGGLKVYRPDKVDRLIARDGVKEFLLAMPEAPRHQRRAAIERLQHYPVLIRTLPAMEDIAAGRVKVTALRVIDVDDLLGRDLVLPDPELFECNIRGKAVMVTGCGGSIGSELSRQILKLAPIRLVLFELSEVALYEVEMQLMELLEKPEWKDRPTPAISAVLGSVLDEGLVRHTITIHGIQTIYHAAAYKHVPIVELNPISGLKNNTFGTAVLADAAKALGVERFVLISTDKAVRPTNIMGASKRLAELILQAHAADDPHGTVFTMVRFGNVLDSSGSVVRRFRRQIEAGGPVTVTHPKIIRYFMSIPEAAQLVVQAGAMAEGGELFVLDMGEPIKIDDLARSMIRLMGLEVRDEAYPEGDIEIEYVGLRPGEKLYEELLIGGYTTATRHPRIMRNQEPFLPRPELEREIEALRAAMANEDVEAIRAVLARTVEGYTPNGVHGSIGVVEAVPESLGFVGS